MKERILQLLTAEGMTSMKFAEIMEVRPSNISHILSGRNNPGFDFIARLLRRFRDINPDWLINGEGDMYRTPRDLNILDSANDIGSSGQITYGRDSMSGLHSKKLDNHDINKHPVMIFETGSIDEVIDGETVNDLTYNNLDQSTERFNTEEDADIQADRSIVRSPEHGNINMDGAIDIKAKSAEISTQNDYINDSTNNPSVANYSKYKPDDTEVLNDSDVENKNHYSGSNTISCGRMPEKESTCKEPRKVLILYNDNTFEIYNNKSL